MSTLCGATVDVMDGPYGEPITWQRCGLPAGHRGACVEETKEQIAAREEAT